MMPTAKATEHRTYRPAPSFHNPRLGPAVCMCLDCCRIVAEMRCTAHDATGRYRCGDYKGHRDEHSMFFVATCFAIAEERLRLDSPPPSHPCPSCGGTGIVPVPEGTD